MKKQVLSTLALCACLGGAQAQTDVTSQYLVNPSFEENVSYTADAQATNIKTENKIQNDYADNGWERTSAIVDWGISGSVRKPGCIPSPVSNITRTIWIA